MNYNDVPTTQIVDGWYFRKYPGATKQKASKHPIFVSGHGKIKWVLMSIDEYERLAAEPEYRFPLTLNAFTNDPPELPPSWCNEEYGEWKYATPVNHGTVAVNFYSAVKLSKDGPWAGPYVTTVRAPLHGGDR